MSTATVRWWLLYEPDIGTRRATRNCDYLGEGKTSGLIPNGERLAAITAVRFFGTRGWTASILGALASGVVVGIPTAMIDNPVFVRMTPIRSQDYVIWLATALLAGLIIGTYAVSTDANQKPLLSGGLLSAFAVGCPVCNKLVVLLIGTSGALSFFAPLQIYIGLAALTLLAYTPLAPPPSRQWPLLP